MSTPISTRLKRRLASGLAIVSAAGMMLVGLPAAPAQAAPGDVAKITTGKRCDQLHLKKTYPRTPANSGAPGSGHHEVFPGADEQYFFDNLFKGFDNLAAPTDQQIDKAGRTDADIDAWDKKYAASKNPDDMRNGIYARYGRFKDTASNPNLAFGKWMSRYLINNEINNHKGGEFERKTVRDFNMVGPDWLCEVTVEIRDKDGKLVTRRKYDSYNQKRNKFGEFKSNGKYRSNQLGADKIVMRHRDAKFDFTKNKLVMYAGDRATKGTTNQYGALNRALQGERSTAANPVRIYERRATGKGVYPTTKYSKSYQVMNPDPAKGSRGPLNDAAFESGKTPADAKALQRQYQQANTRSGLGRGPGGIDFSTLQLQYVGNPVKGKGLDYSVKADYMADEDENPGYGGQAKLELASDAMFAWLALTPDKFWVNLNPDQPDKIMDSTFAKTDAGRVLLESDLAMKKDFANAINPDKHAGARTFWDTAPRRDGLPCFPMVRLWIEPEPAKVREQDGGIYILDAPLKVSTEWMDVDYENPGARICKLTDAEKRTSETLLRANVMPEVEKRVNTTATYADLRRVYASRVAAEWIRQQDAKKPTDFRKIINSNDIDRWKLRAPNQNWSKNETWQRYMKSYREGAEWFELRYGGKVYNQGVGGIDFSKSPKRNITETRFKAEHPRLPATTRTSVRAETSARDTDTSYLGGNGAGQTGNGGGTPTPTPTPTDPGKPDPTPSAPGEPDPTHTDHPEPGGTGGNRPDPDGDLAHTGNDLPVGLITGIAAVAVAAGAGLVSWRRRRNAAG
ncbi:hypothetical protein AB0N93_08505 [Streptomyces sp. NPDC091267]|uniref:hypothetical protein n=1 Tax=Streptomyces sp. NPDC091267 TaxID=3155195 RepID=UPI00341EE1C8